MEKTENKKPLRVEVSGRQFSEERSIYFILNK